MPPFAGHSAVPIPQPVMPVLRFLAALTLLPLLALPVAAATLEEMAGQMILVGFEGNDPTDAGVQSIVSDLKAGRLGGVMYLKKNVANLETVRDMNGVFRAASPDLLPFITLDQEGGAVERLTRDVGFDEIPSAEAIAASTSPEQAEVIYGRMAKGIAEQGFSVNFGPVADLNINPDNQIIARFGRSYSADPTVVIDYDAAFVRAHRDAGLATALKHFPGHGSSTADSHEGFVDISRTWSSQELLPYRVLIDQDMADMVMVGHLYHSEFANDDGETPSSLSQRWIEGVLREELGFDGVVISDDLEMGAIREHFGLEETVVKAVRAGMDILLFSNTADYRPGLAQEVLDILMDEAADDPAFAARIEESYRRIEALKARLQ